MEVSAQLLHLRVGRLEHPCAIGGVLRRPRQRPSGSSHRRCLACGDGFPPTRGRGYDRRRSGGTMKVVVIGGTGLIGSLVVSQLSDHGHEALAASLDTGVNTLTGAGLAQVLDGTDVVVDVSNSPSLEAGPAMELFTTSTNIIIAAEQAFGLRHHVALSVVGSERVQQSGYFRAKLMQERLIQRSGIPFTIVRATQFYEFLGRIT